MKFNDKGELARPADYREWVFLTAGLGMTYGPNAPRAGQPAPFSNVFVNPDSYREFMQTGKWPNGTMFILEIRGALENVSINNGGRTQGDIVAVEASVKDTTRFPDGGWAYFGFDDPGGLKPAAAPFPRTASLLRLPQQECRRGVVVYAVLSAAIRSRQAARHGARGLRSEAQARAVSGFGRTVFFAARAMSH